MAPSDRKFNMNDSLKTYIASHPFFQGIKPDHLEVIMAGAAKMSFGADGILFRERDPASRFYLIQSGRVALEAHLPVHGTAKVQILGAGDVLGWSWLFPPYVWHFQARTLEPTEVVALDGAHLLVNAERDRDFGYELMKRVAQVVIQRLQSTRREILAAQSAAATTSQIN